MGGGKLLIRFMMAAAIGAAITVAGPCRADMVVIAAQQSEMTSLSRREVVNIFMGRFRYLPSGHAVKPYDLPASDTRKARFYQVLTGKEIAEIDAYWTRLVLTGTSRPPEEITGPEAMLERIAHNPWAIGYVERSQVDRRVRIVFEAER